MTAISQKLLLCMLLLTTLLHATTTTDESKHQQARNYRTTRRFIEIGSERASNEKSTDKSVIYENDEKWGIGSTEDSRLSSESRYQQAIENAKETQKKASADKHSNKSVKSFTRSATHYNLSAEKHKLDTNSENTTNAKVKKSILCEISKHQIVLDAATISSSKTKVHHKAHLSATTQPLHTTNAPTNHINYTPNEEFAPHAKWVTQQQQKQQQQRFKRQQTAHAHKTQESALHGGSRISSSSAISSSNLNTLAHYNPLPAVPLPPPPPFPGNFAISPFSSGVKQGSSSRSNNNFLNAFAGFGNALGSNTVSSTQRKSSPLCGGILKSRYGSIQTPNFPHKFSTPIECVWVIDASELPITASLGGATAGGGGGGAAAASNISIIVYLTQLYVLGGLKFTEYMYYSDDYKVPAHRVFTLTEDDVTQVAWVQFSSQYLEIRFTLESLDGTHLRALDRLLDVYGFNITYEVQQEVKTYQCNTLQCRFLGHCYAKADYSSYYCSCFPGFSGVDCGRGPLCEDPHTNICQNGGTCKHIGDAAITCHCPSGFKGTKCEIPEINEITMGCTSNTTSSDCHKECDFERAGESILLRKASKITARNGKTRYEVTIRLGANLTAFYRNMDPERRPSDHLPSLLERHSVVEFETISLQNMPPSSSDEWKRDLYTDVKYLLQMASAISDGFISAYLWNIKPGLVSHSRWLTKASRILRLYVATSSPSSVLKTLAEYVIKVYVPMYFNIKYYHSVIYGSPLLFKFIRLTQFLPTKERQIINAGVQNNSYSAHPENAMLSMLYDDRKSVRDQAIKKNCVLP